MWNIFQVNNKGIIGNFEQVNVNGYILMIHGDVMTR